MEKEQQGLPTGLIELYSQEHCPALGEHPTETEILASIGIWELVKFSPNAIPPEAVDALWQQAVKGREDIDPALLADAHWFVAGVYEALKDKNLLELDEGVEYALRQRIGLNYEGRFLPYKEIADGLRQKKSGEPVSVSQVKRLEQHAVSLLGQRAYAARVRSSPQELLNLQALIANKRIGSLWVRINAVLDQTVQGGSLKLHEHEVANQLSKLFDAKVVTAEVDDLLRHYRWVYLNRHRELWFGKARSGWTSLLRRGEVVINEVVEKVSMESPTGRLRYSLTPQVISKKLRSRLRKNDEDQEGQTRATGQRLMRPLTDIVATGVIARRRDIQVASAKEYQEGLSELPKYLQDLARIAFDERGKQLAPPKQVAEAIGRKASSVRTNLSMIRRHFK